MNLTFKTLLSKLYLWLPIFFAGLIGVGFLTTQYLSAQNISTFKDTISDSAPGRHSNHTLSFRVGTTIPPAGYIDIEFPSGFGVIGTTTFSANRNVQLFVDGVPRTVSDTLSGVSDRVEIFPGSPGSIRYTINTISPIPAGSQLELRIGNHTTLAQLETEVYDAMLEATTTISGDIKPILNATSTGLHRIPVRLFDADSNQIGYAGFTIFLINPITLGPADTTETDPPERFNGAPEGIISGIALAIEISLETNEFAWCRYSTLPDIPFTSMTNFFNNTGLIFHTTVVPVLPNATSTYYIRCIDDEDNFNIDDYIIEFFINALPTGETNEEGDEEGDGSGTGDGGGGAGDGTGDNPGSGTGTGTGGTSPGGGGGGGSGGGGGGGSGGGGGGGFESTPGPFESGDARIIISGTAPASSRLYVLVDGQERGNVAVNNRGGYEITIDQITRGAHTFGIYAIDRNNVRTSTFSTSFTVQGARASALSNIHIPPSVRVLPNPVDPGQVATISGVSVPGATIAVEHERDGGGNKQTFTTTADNNTGVWSIPIDTAGFAVGTYRVRAKAEADGVTTNFSNFINYGVGQQATPTINADLNRDGRVNLTDFSILLFWWGTAGGASDPPADINQDGRVNLTDFSILLFNWTG